MHVGWGEWIIVDSCVGADGQTPAALDYLKRIGVDLAAAVKRVVATHWHNDHVRGLSRTMRECASAPFICSQALWTKEFVALTELWRKQRLATSPLAEMTRVMELIAKSGSVLRGSTGESRLRFALANRCLWRREQSGDMSLGASGELYSLSPSDAAVKRSLEAIAALFSAGDTLTRPTPSRPNQFSVVLWLRVGDVRLLLGADMEEQNNPCGGWRLIVDSPERPTGHASLFKVPHHGSVTGECESVWTNMLSSNPVAMLTPFQSGRVKLPTEKDAERICGRTSEAYITASHRAQSSRGKTGSVNRTIHETVRYIRKVNDAFGQVRARRRINPQTGGWTVATFGDARPLSELRRKPSV